MIIFYDGNCPLCSTEMSQLQRFDIDKKIVFADLNASDFSVRYAHIDKDKAMAYLHAQTQSGEIVYGLDATYLAWKTVGKHRWLKIFRLPIIRLFADCGYRLFAKYRHTISQLLMPNTHCNNGQCSTERKGEK
jgi:predicted DCC family thiol-disulfide oxidoreductase YuxK